MRLRALSFLFGLWLAHPALAGYRIQLLDPPGAQASQAFKINETGEVVGTYWENGGAHGFVYGDGVFDTVDYPGAAETRLLGLDDSGNAVGAYRADDGWHGFQAGLDTGGVPAVADSFVTAINNSAEFVGYWGPPGASHGFLNSFGTLHDPVDVPSATSTVLMGINDAGQIAGFYADVGGTHHGFYQNPDGALTTLDFGGQGVLGTYAQGIDANGLVVGYFDQQLGATVASHGFLWSGGAFTLFDVAEATATRLFGSNLAGQLVGEFTDAQGVRHGFLATPGTVPEPGMLALLGGGLVSLFAWRVRTVSG
ncbi:PEP-CTERM sorting domain-containing protein [Candidatus Methylocalor cossyra]|uniref:Ice-binding protein C-terminal domain-containing protein n=1 Tax=Candidatus Methylocalor cossyra TaxID=3108543 RepID=A0ABP1C6A4_9GAMM